MKRDLPMFVTADQAESELGIAAERVRAWEKGGKVEAIGEYLPPAGRAVKIYQVRSLLKLDGKV